MNDQSCNCGCGTTAVIDKPAEACQCGCCGPETANGEEIPEPETTH